MAMIETWFSQDLNEPVKVHQLDGNVFSQDNQGNLIGVNVFDGDEPATLSGSVSASVIRSDGTTVAVSGALSGNSCYIILPAAAYAVPGILSIIIKLTGGGSTTTLCAVVANVYQSATDATVDPGTIIPDISELIAEIESAIASIPADYSNLWKALAPNFSTSTAYKVGQYVTYNGGLYRFKIAHSGSWNSAHATKVDISAGLTRVSNALDGSGIFQLAVERGNITVNGIEEENDARLRTGLIDVRNTNYIGIFLQSDFRMSVLFYNADGSYAGSSSDWGDVRSTNRWYDVSTRSFIRCVVIHKNPPSGYVMPFEVAQHNYVIVYKSTNNYLASFEKHYIERDSSGIYLRWTGDIWLRGSVMKVLPNTDNSGLTLVDSPLGVEDCVYLQTNETLAFDTTTQSVSVIQTEQLHENATLIALLSVITMMDHKGKAFGVLRDALAEGEREFLAMNEIMSFTYQNEPYFEYAGSSGIYFNLNGGMGYMRGYYTGRNWTSMETIPLADGISLVTSPMGKTNCLFIPHNDSAIWVPFVNKVFIVPNVDLWKYPYSVVLWQVIGNKGHDYVVNGIGNRGIKYINDAEGVTIDSGNVFFEYNSSFNNIDKNIETFMFFSDPHVMGHTNNFDAGSMSSFVNALRFGFENTPTSFIVDGGDWLNYHDYQANACYMLGLIDGIMRKNFPNYHPINGNHDLNYQGYVSEQDQSAGDLTKDTMIALHYREENAMYYSFDGLNTKNYVFDSGTDFESGMTDYRWQQVDWFANQLLSDDPEHGIVWVHIAFTDWQTFDPTKFGQLITNIGQVISAYNSRSSVTLKGVTYNFTGKTGKVWAIMCGHTHADMQGTLGGVPVVSVINAIHDGVISYDLGYFDFSNEVLKLFRIGSGSNRTINL